ncbi:MAG TPA: ATP-binding protein [Chloroflexota bacterium]|nr:ATP-binding protein [Chloroflexota bacterium]
MTPTNAPGTDRGPAPAAHHIRVRLLVSYVVMIALAGLSWAVTASMTSTLRAGYTHTVNVVDALSANVVLRTKLMDDEETGLRGYLLTRQPVFLQPYAAARAALPALRRRTETLAQADPQLRREVTVLERRAQAWETWAQQVLRQPRAHGSNASAVRAQQLAGKSLFDAYRAAADRLSGRLALLRRQDLQQGLGALQQVNTLAGLLFAAVLVLGALIAWQTTRSVVQPLRYLGQAAEAIGRGALSQPVTVRAAREFEELARSMDRMRRQLASQRALATTIGSTLHHAEVYADFAAHVRELVPYDFLSLALITDDGSTLETVYATGVAAEAVVTGVRRPLRDDSLCGQVYRSRAPVVYDDVAALPVEVLSGDARRMAAAGLRAGGIVPLCTSQRVTGLIHVVRAGPDPYTLDILTPLITLAPLIAAALENAHLYQALETTAVDLRRSNAELEQFAYVASHDLQEPLRMISSYIQLLQRRYQGQLDAKADTFIGFAVDGVTRMQRLINDLLAYSRVGTHGAPLVPTDCGEVVAGAIAALGAPIAETGARVIYGELPTVLGDATQLGQLFQNLIGNALKFCTGVTPEIMISAERAGGEWLFRVCDNGIGIDPAYAERIFIIFQRLHSREEYPGTGIGLAICKKIVERHGGRIWVESQPGQGATFTFSLPDAASMKGRAA